MLTVYAASGGNDGFVFIVMATAVCGLALLACCIADGMAWVRKRRGR